MPANAIFQIEGLGNGAGEKAVKSLSYVYMYIYIYIKRLRSAAGQQNVRYAWSE